MLGFTPTLGQVRVATALGFLLRRTQCLDHGHGALLTAQSSFGCGWPIPTMQPDSRRTTLRQLCATIVSGVAATPLAVADAQCAWHDAHLFCERGSRSPDEFSSIHCSRRTRLSPVLCLRRGWKRTSPQLKLSIVAGRSSMLQMSGTTSQVGLYRNPNLAKCGGEAQHLKKLGIWSPPELPNVQSSTAGPKTPLIGVFLVSLERS